VATPARGNDSARCRANAGFLSVAALSVDLSGDRVTLLYFTDRVRDIGAATERNPAFAGFLLIFAADNCYPLEKTQRRERCIAVISGEY
jgi:hypothetical protein